MYVLYIRLCHITSVGHKHFVWVGEVVVNIALPRGHHLMGISFIYGFSLAVGFMEFLGITSPLGIHRQASMARKYSCSQAAKLIFEADSDENLSELSDRNDSSDATLYSDEGETDESSSDEEPSRRRRNSVQPMRGRAQTRGRQGDRRRQTSGYSRPRGCRGPRMRGPGIGRRGLRCRGGARVLDNQGKYMNTVCTLLICNIN